MELQACPSKFYILVKIHVGQADLLAGRMCWWLLFLHTSRMLTVSHGFFLACKIFVDNLLVISLHCVCKWHITFILQLPRPFSCLWFLKMCLYIYISFNKYLCVYHNLFVEPLNFYIFLKLLGFSFYWFYKFLPPKLKKCFKVFVFILFVCLFFIAVCVPVSLIHYY